MIKPKVKEYLRVIDANVEDEKNVELILGSSPSTEHRIESDKSVLTLLKLCDGNHTIEEIHNLMQNEHKTSEIDINEGIQALHREGILEEGNSSICSLSEGEAERYARHFVYYSIFTENSRYLPQEQLKNAKVTLIGMGGIGKWVSLKDRKSVGKGKW